MDPPRNNARRHSSRGHQQQLAVCLALLQLAMGLRRLGQRESPTERDSEPAIRNPALQVVPGLGPAFRRVGGQPEAADFETAAAELVRMYWGRGAARLPDEYEVSVGPQCGQALCP